MGTVQAIDMAAETKRLKALIELAVPAIMLALTHESLRMVGKLVRQDMQTLTERALRDTVYGLDPLSKHVVADKATEDAVAILTAANEDDPETRWAMVAHFILKASQNGAAINREVQLIALAIEADNMEHGQASKHGGWRKIDEAAGKMENAARFRGLFLYKVPEQVA